MRLGSLQWRVFCYWRSIGKVAVHYWEVGMFRVLGMHLIEESCLLRKGWHWGMVISGGDRDASDGDTGDGDTSGVG